MQLRRCCSALLLLLICLVLTTGLNVAEGSSGAPEASQRVFNPSMPGEVVENAFLRIARDEKSKMVAFVKSGTKVEILEEWLGGNEIAWYLVKKDGAQGWIQQMSVRKLAAKEPTPAVKTEAPARNSGVGRIDPPIPAEVLEKSFIRADHDHKSKTLAACSEGAGVDIVGDWTAPDGIRWYQVKAENVGGWMMAKFVRPLVEEAGETLAPPARSPSSAKAADPSAVKPASNGDYIAVTAKGSGTSRAEAVEMAWMEAVRLAVGVVITSKTEVTNEEISERIIAHSRGIVESYRVIDERKDGERIDVTIEARVHRQTLVDATKTYGEAFVVDASTSAAKDAAAKAKTEAQMKKTGMELLKEVLDSYGPEMFLTAHINPELFYDKNSGQHTVEVIEVFNEKLFWDEFLPRLREALEGVAVSKKKKTYTPEVRANNQRLTSEKFIIDRESAICNYDSFSPQDLPYCTDGEFNFYSFKEFPVVIPNDHSTYTSYLFRVDYDANLVVYNSRLSREHDEKPVGDIVVLLLDWWKKMDSHVTYMVSFLDDNGDVIHVQPYETGPRGITIYRSLKDKVSNYLLRQPFVFAPGFASPFVMDYREPYNSKYLNFLYLDTTKMSRRWTVDKYINDKVDRIKSIKLETIFEQ